MSLSCRSKMGRKWTEDSHLFRTFCAATNCDKLSEKRIEVRQLPHRLVLGIHRCGQEARVFCCLRVSQQIVEKLRGGGAEQPFNDRAVAGLGSGTSLLGAVVAREHTVKIPAVELLASIHDQRLWQP